MSDHPPSTKTPLTAEMGSLELTVARADLSRFGDLETELEFHQAIWPANPWPRFALIVGCTFIVWAFHLRASMEWTWPPGFYWTYVALTVASLATFLLAWKLTFSKADAFLEPIYVLWNASVLLLLFSFYAYDPYDVSGFGVICVGSMWSMAFVSKNFPRLVIVPTLVHAAGFITLMVSRFDMPRFDSEPATMIVIVSCVGVIYFARNGDQADRQQYLTAVSLREEVARRLRAETEARAAESEARAHAEALQAAQAQLVQADKLASLGALVAGVAHEINTPLGIAVTATTHIRDECERLGRALEAGELKRSSLGAFLVSASKGLSLSYANLARAADLVRSFKQVAVDQHGEERRSIDLLAYLDDILASLEPIVRSARITVTRDVPPDLRLTLIPGALAQVVTNIVQNAAIHAFEGVENKTIHFHARSLADGKVLLSIKDNGVGMGPEIRAKAFEPFYTTRRDRGGTGLGLHIVHNQVTGALNGTVALNSEPGKGTEFVIMLKRDRA